MTATTRKLGFDPYPTPTIRTGNVQWGEIANPTVAELAELLAGIAAAAGHELPAVARPHRDAAEHLRCLLVHLAHLRAALALAEEQEREVAELAAALSVNGGTPVWPEIAQRAYELGARAPLAGEANVAAKPQGLSRAEAYSLAADGGTVSNGTLPRVAASGTTGTAPGAVAIATVRGVEGVLIMRVQAPDSCMWAAARHVNGGVLQLDGEDEVTVTSRAVVVTEVDRDKLIARFTIGGASEHEIREWFDALLGGGRS